MAEESPDISSNSALNRAYFFTSVEFEPEHMSPRELRKRTGREPARTPNAQALGGLTLERLTQRISNHPKTNQ